jgi:hypothetical protein
MDPNGPLRGPAHPVTLGADGTANQSAVTARSEVFLGTPARRRVAVSSPSPHTWGQLQSGGGSELDCLKFGQSGKRRSFCIAVVCH